MLYLTFGAGRPAHHNSVGCPTCRVLSVTAVLTCNFAKIVAAPGSRRRQSQPVACNCSYFSSLGPGESGARTSLTEPCQRFAYACRAGSPRASFTSSSVGNTHESAENTHRLAAVACHRDTRAKHEPAPSANVVHRFMQQQDQQWRVPGWRERIAHRTVWSSGAVRLWDRLY